MKNKNKKLEESNASSQVISGSPIPTFVIDCDHKVTHFNKACEILTGISANRILGTCDQWRAFYSEKRPVLADIVLLPEKEQYLDRFYKGKCRASSVKPGAYEAEDFFPELGNNGRWLFFTASPLTDEHGEVTGAIETLQDITREKTVFSMNQSMLRISKALHHYTYLEDLLTFISQEIKGLLGCEGALVIMVDPKQDELYFPGISYDDPGHEKRVREIRFSVDDVVAGRVIKEGRPLILNGVPTEKIYQSRDRKLGYVTRSLVEVPVFIDNRVIGVLTGINKKKGSFCSDDVNVLTSLAGTVALSIENTQYQEELRQTYREVRSLNIAKDKAINHLAHELKTPVAILSEAVSVLKDDLENLPDDDWKPVAGMIDRQLKRISEIKEEVSDIITGADIRTPKTLLWLTDQLGDLLSALAFKNMRRNDIINAIKSYIQNIFSPETHKVVPVDLGMFVTERLDCIGPSFCHRDVSIISRLEKTKKIILPKEILGKIVDGLVRNAFENTPDEGSVEICVWEKGNGVFLSVKDTGVGILKEHRNRIFEGFFPTQDITAYSTRKPFDFDAGGRGADLLRMKIFSEAYGFTIDMASMRCPYLGGSGGKCPGRISQCGHSEPNHPCSSMGGTEFILRFTPVESA